MHDQQPVSCPRSARSTYSRSSSQQTSLLPRLLFAYCTLGLWAATPLFSSAGENLWLDVARSSITSSELHSHVSVLADDMLEGREAGSRGGREAAKYILNAVKAAQLKPGASNDSFTQPFHGRSQNLLAVLEGADPKLRDEYIVIGAHYDHVGYGTRRNSYGPIGYIHNGADDNASGVATLLEVIDALASSAHRPQRSILFAFWDGEEKGLLGSKHWLYNPTVPLESVKLKINIDMVGRLTNGRIELMGSRSAPGLRKIMSSNALAEGTWVDFTWDFKDNSDHWPFFQRGIPALCIHTGLHDDYHRPSDDIEKINVDGMREVSRYLVEQLCDLADVDALPKFRPNSRRETPHTQKRVEARLADLPSRLAFTWNYDKESNQLRVQQVFQVGENTEARLRPGDRIIAVNSQPVTGEALLPMLALESESQLELSIVRTGSDSPLTIITTLTGNPVQLGLSWRENEAEPGTVYITRVVPHSPAARAGIQLYDRIHSLAGKPIVSQDELLNNVKSLLDEDAEQFQLEIESRGLIREVTVSLQTPTADSGDATL